jgi:Tfp pilus assembly protein PilV
MNISHRQSGFSMIEALIAAIVLSVAVAALAGLQRNVLTNSSDSRVRTLALNYAQAKLEEIRSFARLSDIQALSGDSGSDVVALDNVSLSRDWSVTADQGGYYDTVVTVSWTDTFGDVQTVQLDTSVNQAQPARSGELLLAAFSPDSLAPPSAGNGTPADTEEQLPTNDEPTEADPTGDDSTPGQGSEPPANTDPDPIDPDDSTGSPAGGGSVTPLTFGGVYAGCTLSSPCTIAMGSTFTIPFTSGQGYRVVSMSVTGEASKVSSGWDQESGAGDLSVKADNGNGKTFRVSVQVEDTSGVRQTFTLSFITSNK